MPKQEYLRIGKGAIIGWICGIVTASKVKAHKRRPKKRQSPRDRKGRFKKKSRCRQ
ncbi:MAG: hypothetical protein ABOK23_06875 [Candidatus Methanoperedens sp.]|nr:hypothetical protein [Candidatus Methanoperedens sp.]